MISKRMYFILVILALTLIGTSIGMIIDVFTSKDISDYRGEKDCFDKKGRVIEGLVCEDDDPKASLWNDRFDIIMIGGITMGFGIMMIVGFGMMRRMAKDEEGYENER